MAEDRLTWLYAVVTDLSPAVLEGLTGAGGEQVYFVGAAGPSASELGAVAGAVDAGTFAEDALERRLSQSAELEQLARAHHNVIDTLAAAGPTLPLRLATVYLDEGAVRQLLAERADEFTTTLRWLAPHTECGVKVWADPNGLAVKGVKDQADHGPNGNGPTGAGAAYLHRRRADLAAREVGWQRATALSDDIHAALGALAVAARRHGTHDAQAPEGASSMILNGAYLIDREQVESFAAAAEAVARGHGAASLEVTGPWPPYSFAEGPQQ
jgi:hypothetical protein